MKNDKNVFAAHSPSFFLEKSTSGENGRAISLYKIFLPFSLIRTLMHKIYGFFIKTPVYAYDILIKERHSTS
ncbi:hypothetical protein [Heyndrickxia camelliae]|uniref:hypothetical protein n=1 Tax=Heyndrickxia camelliae TaxID=1707093 RepID=UPI0013031B2B|nr:hypothetical protein [Heyndrickxia camelliae]